MLAVARRRNGVNTHMPNGSAMTIANNRATTTGTATPIRYPRPTITAVTAATSASRAAA